MSTSNNTALLLINLDRSEDRLDRSKKQLAKFDLVYRRIPAVDGRELSPETLSKLLAPEYSGYYKALSAAEIGCYMSHIKCWQYVVDNELDYAVVLEDDFTIKEDLSKVHNYVAAIDQPWDFIKLMEYPEKRSAFQSFDCLDKTLIRYDKIPSRTCAYIVSNLGARKMLKHSETISRPIDIDFQYWWESSILVFGLKPYMVEVNHAEESTIDSASNRKSIRKSVIKQYLHKLCFKLNNKKHLRRLRNNKK